MYFHRYFKIQYIYIIFIIVWTPINFIINMDAMGRLKMILTIVTFVILYNNDSVYRRCLKNGGMKILVLLVGYMICNYLILYIPSRVARPGEQLVQVFNLIYPVITASVVIYEIYKKRESRLYNVIIFAYYLWTILLLGFNNGMSEQSGRLTIQGIDGNDFAFVGCIIVFLIYIKCLKYNMSVVKGIILSIMPIILIVLSGSRTAFGCVVMIVATMMIVLVRHLDAKKFMVILILSVIAGGGLFYVMENTTLGERLSDTSTQSKNGDMETGTFVDVLGDRGPFYYYGFMKFTEEPVHGIGLTNFSKLRVWGWGSTGLVCHSEYMVQLSECGIIGFILYVSFLCSLWYRICKASLRKLIVPRPWLYCGLGMVVFIPLFFWTYDRLYIFIIYGIIIGYTQHVQIYSKITVRNKI